MAIVYIESSALVKRYLPEQGTEVIDELFDRRTSSEFFVISLPSALEIKSVFVRLAKAGRISDAEVRELLASFWADRTKVSSILPFDNSLVEEASGHLDRHPVRTLDAVHVASILRVKETAQRSGERLIVVACDHEVVQACREENIEVLNPESESAQQELSAIRETA